MGVAKQREREGGDGNSTEGPKPALHTGRGSNAKSWRDSAALVVACPVVLQQKTDYDYGDNERRHHQGRKQAK